MNFNYRFPAIRGYQAGKEFFSIICPLDVLSKLFTFYNNEIPQEFRAQRVINEKRIPEISNYILNNADNYVFSSITASIDGDYNFISSNNVDDNIGMLEVSMTSSLLINDGQHRKAAIDEALNENPTLKNESISVVLFVDQGLKRSQQMFSDLNKHAVKVSKSLGILYNHRDPKIQFLKEFLDQNKEFNVILDKSHDVIAKKSNKLFSLNNFNTAFERSYNHIELKDHNDLKKFVIDYWNYLSKDFKEWSFVINKESSAYHARQNSVAVYGIVLESLALLCYYMYSENITSWKSTLRKLNKIDWCKSNQDDWLNRCMLENGSMHKSTKFIYRTYYRIKELLDFELTESELAHDQDLRKEV
ncbi:DNA sulfur modification protein DndB [Clostridium sediminicola]|uniref:DNA sulfur modification protein DndB n=1 Tax=Clostridium sediminicola TaxID=3114879 RepID=UPI0031F1DF54